MDMISPSALDHLDQSDKVKFFRVERLDQLDCLKATFRKHVFPPHTHEAYAIGTVLSGQHVYSHLGIRLRSSRGHFCFINPDEVHDGMPHEGGYTYRMVYPKVSLLIRLMEETTGKRAVAPHFGEPVVHDPELTAHFIHAHELLEQSTETFAADEAITIVLLQLIERYGGRIPPSQTRTREPQAVSRAKDFLSENLDGQADLNALADAAGLSPFHLIRVFRKATGLTPHAWLVDRRVHRATELLRQGRAPAGIALSCGFADQSHLSRLFKSRVGVTPGQYKGNRAA